MMSFEAKFKYNQNRGKRREEKRLRQIGRGDGLTRTRQKRKKLKGKNKPSHFAVIQIFFFAYGLLEIDGNSNTGCQIEKLDSKLTPFFKMVSNWNNGCFSIKFLTWFIFINYVLFVM